MKLNLLHDQLCYTGIIISTIVAFVFSGAWHGPWFGKIWFANSKWTEKRMKNSKIPMGKLLGGQFLCYLIGAYVFAVFYESLGVTDILDSLKIAVIFWGAFSATVTATGVLWEGDKPLFYLINIGSKFFIALFTAAIYHYLSVYIKQRNAEVPVPPVAA